MSAGNGKISKGALRGAKGAWRPTRLSGERTFECGLKIVREEVRDREQLVPRPWGGKDLCRGLTWRVLWLVQE